MTLKEQYHTEITRIKRRGSSTRYKVGAIMLDRKGKPLAVTTNKPRLAKRGGGIHAEIAAVRKAPKGNRVLLVRIGKGGDLRPIHPCTHCAKLLTKLDIAWEGVW